MLGWPDRAGPETVKVGPSGVDVAIRRSARARKFTLRIAAGTGEATLTVPRRAALRTIVRFLEDHQEWLLTRQAAQPGPVLPSPGVQMPFEGRPVRLVSTTGRRAVLDGDQLGVPGEGERFVASLKAWLKLAARDRLAAACDLHASGLAVQFTRITLRDTRTRWGSCTSDGALMFSWRLVMAPPEILNYVAAHEVAHLVELNHSPAFWALVADCDPNFRTHRAWLRDNGAALHRYRF